MFFKFALSSAVLVACVAGKALLHSSCLGCKVNVQSLHRDLRSPFAALHGALASQYAPDLETFRRRIYDVRLPAREGFRKDLFNNDEMCMRIIGHNKGYNATRRSVEETKAMLKLLKALHADGHGAAMEFLVVAQVM